jgi:HK97 family phage portal protein
MPAWLDRWLSRRSAAITWPPGYHSAWWPAGPTQAGPIVTPELALTVPAVFACCQVLAQDVARTPIKLRQQIAPDTFTDAVDHPLYELLSSLPNPETTAYSFKHAMQWQLLLHGAAYAQIVRDADRRIVALWPLLTRSMWVDRTPAPGFVKRWTYSDAAGVRHVWLFDPSYPPILELTHETPITRCREIIGVALAQQQYVGTFFRNGARPDGIVQAAGKLTLEQKQGLRDQWNTLYRGAGNAHRVAIFDSGLDFKSIAMENDSAQLNETLRSLNEQIAGAFRVPTWKVGDLSKATYSNMQAGELAYVTSTLDPFFECWTEALRRDVLTARQYGAYRVEFDRQALVRNDVAALNTALATGINAGYLSQNDARKALGLNPIPDGDVYRVNSALQPVSGGTANVA